MEDLKVKSKKVEFNKEHSSFYRVIGDKLSHIYNRDTFVKDPVA
jgi:hypothetical protein